MTGSGWTHMHRFLDLKRDIEETFGSLIDEPWGRTPGAQWMPAVDIYETRDAYIVSVDLPGVGADEVELHVRTWEIEICGTRAASRTVASATRVHVERMVGRFCRTLALEHPVEPETAESRCADGVYEVSVKKHTTTHEQNDTREGDSQ